MGLALAAAVALGVAARGAAAQEAPPAEPAAADALPELNWLQRGILERLASGLGLTADQRSRIERVLREAERDRRKVEAEQAARIKALLTADQRKAFEELQRTWNRWGAGGGGGATPGGADPRESPQMKELRELLGLTTAQEDQLVAITQRHMEKGRQRGQEIWQQIQRGQFDWSKLDTELDGFFDAMQKEVDAALTPEQRPKWAKWMGDLRTQMRDPSQWGQLAQRFGQGGGGGGGGGWNRGGTGGGEGGASLQRLLRDLKLSEDERLVLEPGIQAILELDRAWRRAERDHARALRERADAGDVEAVRAALAAAREARERHQRERAAAETALRELVTVSQEAVLVSHGILR
jgi:Spy/CpxP family protein refolding chaperone